MHDFLAADINDKKSGWKKVEGCNLIIQSYLIIILIFLSLFK